MLMSVVLRHARSVVTYKLILLSTLFCQLVVAQSLLTTPEILPNEVYGLTSNGCGIILDMQGKTFVELNNVLPDGTLGKTRIDPVKYIATQVWSGDCSGGLAQGWGKFGPSGPDGVESEYWSESEFAYGRDLGVYKDGHSISYRVSDAQGKISVLRLQNLGEGDAVVPKWPVTDVDLFEGSSFSYADKNYRTEISNCYLDTNRFRGCSGDGYLVYGIAVQDVSEGGGEVVHHWCPQIKSTKGCENLWQELTATPMANLRTELQTYKTERVEMLQQYEAISGPWLAQQDERAAALMAERVTNEAAAASAAASQEQEKQVASQKAEEDFQQQLATANAGELFVLADELDSTGDVEQARLARRALISRFPDSPMAATAAEQMASTTQVNPVANGSDNAQAESGIAVCQQTERASDLPQQLANLPADNINLGTRGIIAQADFMINTYRQCLPDSQAQAIVDQYTATRESALINCRAYSTVDNCLIPPYGPEYEADLQRQEAARQQAESEQDALEMQQAVENLVNTIQQMNNTDAGGDSGSTTETEGDGDFNCGNGVCR